MGRDSALFWTTPLTGSAVESEPTYDLIEAHRQTVDDWRRDRVRDLWRLQDETEYDVLESYTPDGEPEGRLEEEFYRSVFRRAGIRPDW